MPIGNGQKTNGTGATPQAGDISKGIRPLEISLSAAAIQPALKTSSLSRYAAPVELQIEGASSEEKTTPAATQRALAEALAQI
jgi:hypothetical protein